MLNIIIGAVGMWIFLSFVYDYINVYDDRKLSGFFENIFIIPPIFLLTLFDILFYIPIWIWVFFRNVIKPCPLERWNKYRPDNYKQITKNIYLCHDKKKTTELRHKFFLIRVLTNPKDCDIIEVQKERS